jgi:hypothetical protein
MKSLMLLLLFLTFGGISFAQQPSDSCVIVAPTKLQKEGCGDQQVHFRFTSECAIQDLEITIFNRWGEKLHVSNQLEYDLSGKTINQGTYYFALKATFWNGRTVSQNGYFQIP